MRSRLLFLHLLFSLAVGQNYSLSFENSAYVEIPHSDNLNFGENIPMSISFWMNRNTTGEMHHLGKRAGQNNCSFQIAGSGNNIGIGGYPIGDWSALEITSPHSLLNTWTHIVFTFDGDVMIGYIDGTAVGSASGCTLGPTSTASLMIGRLNYGAPSDGKFDEVGIWNRAITQAEIQAYMSTSPTGDETGLVGYWNFNEGSGTTLTDQTSNGNNGTINGATWSTDVPATYSGPTWHVSTTGSDSNDGSEESPFATIQAGIDASSESDTVLVQTGTYSESIDLSEKNILVKGVNSGTTILDGGSNQRLVYLNSAGTTASIKNFTIQNGSATNGAAIFIDNSTFVIDSCIIKNNTGYSSIIHIDNSTVQIKHTLIANNTCTNSSNSYGAIVTYDTCELILDFVTVAYNVRGGLFSHESTSNHTVRNSIFYNPDADEEIGRRASGAIMNLSYTLTGTEIYGCTSSGTTTSEEYICDGMIFDNPLFTDAGNGDFTLQDSSPAIDAGNPDSDSDGVTWVSDVDDQDPDGSQMDMGVYYFAQESGPTDVSGVISSNTNWRAASSPYIATGNILVSEGVTLTIQPGVEVKFSLNTYMKVEGFLNARGTSVNNIIFTSNETSPAAEDWDKIWLKNTSVTLNSDDNYLSGTILEYCQISYAEEGLRIDDSSFLLDYCTLSYNQYGINFRKVNNSIIRNCTFNNNESGTSISAGTEDYGVGIFSNNQFISNTFHSNTGTGLTFGGYRCNSSGNTIQNNISRDNGGSGMVFGWGNVTNGFTNNTITGNIIYNNSGSGLTVGDDPNTITKNIICNNAGSGFSISGTYIYTGITLENNVFANNATGLSLTSVNNSNIRYNSIVFSTGIGINAPDSYTDQTDNTISYNTVFGSGGNAIELEYGPNVLNYNNVFNNSGDYIIKVTGTGSFTEDAENSFWGTTTASEIDNLIYDFNDDFEIGAVDYDPYLTTPNTDAPISPPINVAKQQSGNNVILTWDANPESDVAGYKIHYGNFTGYSYTTNTDLGNVTTYTLSGVSIDSSIAITAYDGNANGTDDQVEGYQSWFATAIIPPYSGPVWYVSTSGSEANEGSENEPFSKIQTAIDSSSSGDTVLVAAGTYTENINYNGKNIVVGSLYLTTQDTSYISSTIIDGNESGSVVNFHNGESNVALLTGFTIQNGWVSPMSDLEYGGGIRVKTSSPTLFNLIIKDNFGRSGGGIGCYSSSPIINNCKILNNIAPEYGGGIYCFNSNPTLNDLKISSNSSSNKGGGLYCDYSSPTLNNITISGNSSSNSGGGIAFNDFCEPTLNNITISGNTADTGGGGIQTGSNCSLMLVNVIIENNSATSGGGLDLNNDSNSTLVDVIIKNNSVPSDQSYNKGGGINCNSSSPTLINVIISGNSANTGGGINCQYDSNPSLMNVTISGNLASEGGGLYLQYSSNPILVNTVSWGNSSDGVVFGTNNSSTLDISYSNIEGGWDGIGNIDSDPLFVDGTNGDYRLLDYSLAIGAGTATNAPTADIDGNARPNPSGSNPDMGAYEHVLGTPLEQTMYYVSTSGSSSGTGFSDSHMSSIQTAIDASTDGDTVLVAAGTYTENINYNGKNIVVISESDAPSTIITPSNSSVPAIWFANNETVSAKLIGFKISGGGNVRGSGIKTESHSEPIIENCIITNCSSSAIAFYYSGATLNNCLIYDNPANVFFFDPSYNNLYPKIINCTITGNSSIGSNSKSYVPTYKNCIIYGQTNTGQFGNVQITYSLIEGGFSGTGNITSNPLFKDASNGDYSLSDYSPAIGAGTATGAPTTDIDGNNRIQPAGSNPDMGAYENALGSPSAPPAPTSLAATVGNGVVNLSWTGNDYATKYYVYRSTTSGASFTKIDSTTAPTVTYSNTGLTNNTVYYFKVSAYGAGGEGSATAEVTATPAPQKYTVKTDATGDYTVIQTAIDATTAGDTVLVYAGTYTENINYNGKNIVVGSLYLTTSDTSYISSTIIDGNEDGSVVKFENSEDASAVLSGFTIQNGKATGSFIVGGIYCNNSSPSIKNLIISNNIGAESINDGKGGGIGCYSGSNPIISNTKIINNSAWHGAGVYCTGSNPTITNTLISNNSGGWGSGLMCESSSTSLINVSIIENSGGGGIYSGGESYVSLVNCILWENTPQQMDLSGGSLYSTYSTIEPFGGNEYYGNIEPGPGNISANPLFVDAANGDYRLSDYSPAIGAGSSDGAPTKDLDGNLRPNPSGSNPDMGAYENALASQRPKAGTIADGLGTDLDWSNTSTELSANWTPFTDNAAVTYEYAVGTGTGNGSSGTNYSLSFDGDNDDVDISISNGDAILNDSPGTIAFWFKMNNTNSDNTPLIVSHEYPGNNFFQFKLDYAAQKLVLHLRDDSQGIEKTLYSIDALEYNTWQFASATIDENFIKYYINGVLQDSEENSGTYDFISSSNRILLAHSYRIAGGSYTNTSLDEVSIWTRALTQGEIQSYISSSPTGTENGLAGYWNFNENTGSTLTDLSGNGNHGTVVGATWSDDAPTITGSGSGAISDILSWTSNSSDTSVTVSGLSLTEGETYTFSARATDTDNQLSDTTTTDGVTIDTDAPVISSVSEGSSSAGSSSGDNYSLSFDGVDDLVNLSDDILLNDPESFTIIIYLKDLIYDLENYSEPFIIGTGEGGHWMIRAFPGEDKIKFSVYIGGTWHAAETTNDYDGAWHSLAAVYSQTDGQITLYKDGLLSQSTSIPTSSLYNHSSWDYLAMGGGFGTNINAKLDELSIWNRELTQSEIQSYLTISPTGSESGIVGYWNFNDGSGDQLTDLSGNGNNGTIVGATWSTDVPATSTGGGDVDYQNDDSELIISWSGSDEVSGISTYEYSLGTTSGGTDAIDWTSTGTAMADTVTSLSLSDGQIYYLSVRATDAAGNVSDIVTGDGITIDLTAPAGTTVTDGTGDDISYTGSDSTLSANWAAFTETVSGIAKYEYTIGTSSGGTDLLDWTDNSTTTSITKTGLSLISGTTYYLSVRGTDGAGNISDVISSDGVTVDLTGPVAGTIIDGTDTDIDWDNSTTTLLADWDGFSDDISGIDHYEYAIGTGGGSSADNYSLSFDGVDDYVQIVNPNLYTNLDQISINLWINIESHTINGTQAIISKWTDDNQSTSRPFHVQMGGNQILFLVNGGCASAEMEVDDLGLNEWNQITFVYDNTNDLIQIYHNGVLKDENSTACQTLYEFSNQMTIGCHAGIHQYFDGNIDEISIWTTALTQEVIQSYMSSSLTGSENGLAGYWNFNEGTGTTLTDQTSNGNDGNIVGATWSEDVPETSSGSPGGTNVVAWTNTGDETAMTRDDLTLANGSTYYVSSRALDNVGNVSESAVSDGITIDTDAPVISSVAEGSSSAGSSSGDNYSLSFDGVDDNVDLPDISNSIGAPNSSFSIIVWFKKYFSDTGVLIHASSSTNYICPRIETTIENKINYYHRNPNTDNGATGDLTFNLGEWNNVTYVVDGNNGSINVYLNGINDPGSSRSFDPNETYYNENRIWQMGAITWDAPHWMNGQLDNVSIWSTAFTQEQIQSVLTSELDGSEDNLFALWNFNENTGSTLTDLSGNGNNGTIVGATWSTDVPATSTGGGDADYQNVASELIISWSGSDEVSGISTYEYALGITSGGTDAIDWTSTGTATSDTVSNLSLSDGQIYYLSVRATDAAGNVSDVLTGDGITIDLTAPAGTTVSDGMGNDIAYTGADSTLSGNWAAFTESVSGIAKYEYAIGTSSGGTDFLDWSDNSSDTTFTKSGLALVNGTSYYMSVRATDGAGNVSTTVTSDGVIVDLAGPVAGTIIDGTDTDIDWTNSTTTLSTEWDGFSDGLSGIDYYEYAIGTTSGGTEIVDWTDSSIDTDELTLTNGTTYYVSGRATDNVGNVSTTVTTDGITVDTDAPVISSVAEGSSGVSSGDNYSLEFDGDGNYVDFGDIEVGDLNDVTIELWFNTTAQTPGSGTNFQALLTKDCNGCEFTSGDWAVTAGSVNNGDITFSINNSTGVGNVNSSALNDGLWHLISITRNSTTGILNLYIDGTLVDTDTGPTGLVHNDDNMYLAKYYISDPSYYEGLFHQMRFWNRELTPSEVQSYMTVSPTGDETGLVGYWNFNEGEGTTLADQTSNGNNGAIVGATWSEDVPTTSTGGGDTDYQNVADELIISWSGSDEVSGISTYEYALGITSGGTDAIDWTSTGTATSDTVSNLSLSDGQIYYLSVRATDAAGNVSEVLTGDGITIDLTAPAGTTVSDGSGEDMAYSGLDSTLSANWSAFTETVSGIAKYEYAIGTSSGGTDVLDWTDNSTTTSITKTGLSLISGTAYYLSVQATDIAGNISNVISSNGVIVDLAGPVAGTIIDGTDTDIDWTNSTTTLSTEWDGFSDVLSGIQKYEYAIGTTSGGTETLSWTDNTTDTTITNTRLVLTNGTTYYVSVRSTDNVGNVSELSVSDGITIDTDAPMVLEVLEGSITEDIDFQNSDSTIIISWSGEDNASGIFTYENALGSTPGGIDIWGWSFKGTATADTISGLNLIENQTYYLSIRATDIAGNISDIMTGDGILIDMTAPVVESILDGSGNDLIFTGSDSSLTANWPDFIDPVSGVAGYEIAVNDGNVYPWTWIGSVLSHTINELDLEHGGLYTVNVRGTDNAGNVSETSSSDGTTVDTEPPGSILNIVDDYYNEAGWEEGVQIQGTAADGNMQSGLSIVEVAIQDTSDNTYWSGNDWTNGEQWLQAEGLDSISYELSADQLADEHIYRVRSRSTDAVGNTQSDYGEDIFTYDITEPNTTLDIADDYYNDAGWDAVTHIQGTAGDATSGSALVSVLIQRDLDSFYYGSDGWVDTVQWQLAQDTENWLYDFSSSNLDNDVTYLIQVRAEDVAGNVETSFASDNFTYDITPPSSDVLIERNFYNNVNWSDANSISGISSDSTSGASSISISILRNSDNYWWGGTNWSSSETWIAPDGVASWTYALNGNNLTNGVSYTVSSRGEDVAGNIQTTLGEDTFIYDLTPPVAGQVFDGLENTDQDWSNSTTEISANWSNFSDVTSGIVGYEYSIGSSPGGTDVLFWTENGADTTFTEDVSLNSGDIYYISVRATDAAENVSNVQTSDGITIDAVDPTVGEIWEGSTEQDYDYQQNSTSLTISWAGSDAMRSFRNGRDLSAFSVSLGTDLAATDVVDWEIVGNVTTYNFSGLDLQEAVTYYANVKALDLAGNESEVVSGDGITIDQSGPIPGSISDGDAADIDWVNINYLSVGNWTGFTDSLSGIGEYEYSLGLAPGQTQVVSWTSSDLDTTITVSASLTEGPTYYANVRAVDSVSNVGGLISSDGFGLDVSAPITGNVYDGLGDDLTWTNITDSIWANWEGFSDLYSGISFYETAVGTSPGGQNTVSWVSADTNISITHAELSLEHGSTYYFSVRATDVVENVSSPGTSNGITIDTLSPVINLMAETSSEDPLFQGSDSSITLLWGADDDLSGIEHYDYALGSTAGETDLLAWTSAGADLSITIGDLILDEGSIYYGSIRVYDQAGNMTEANGNGVTIDITAPDTGSGMDITDINNTADQSYTSSTTTLQASWDGFADNLSGIAVYEYGVGSASLQTDIQDWISVDLDTFMLNSSFTLDNSDTYFISIRAIDSVGNISDAISTDGIIADHEGPFGSLAIDGDSADIDRQNFADNYSGRWETFEDQLSGLAFYEVAIYDSTSASYTIPWDSLGLDTLVEFINLALAQDHEYKLHIRGIDHVQNTGAIIASDGVLIDQTAPMSPQSLVGFFSNERIYLTWDSNLEPDLSHYNVYGGADSLQPVTVLQTGDTEAEAFLPEFSNDEDVFLHITATDIPGNESPKSNWVQGIPQPAMVTRILPDTSITILKDDNTFSIHFSQPLTDIGTVTTASLAYTSMNLEATYSPEDTSIKIIVNDPWASMDTVTFAINNILDWAGSGTNEKTATFTTYLLGDYNNDFSVNVTDLSNFVTAWNNDDTSYELGPVTGTAPHFIPARNQLYDLRDIMVFTRMWHYSHQTSAGRMLVYDPLGSELNIYQEGHRLVVDLPAETKAAHVSLAYPWDSKAINTPDEINSSEVIQLAYNPKELGQLVIEKAFMKSESAKNISFDINTLDRENAVIEINYVAYDDSVRMIASGRQTLDIVAIPDKYALHQNYPNPFNPTTTINYDVPQNGKVKMVIYDLMGREVRTLMNHDLAAGYHTLTWDGKNNIGQIASAGLYFCQLRGQNYTKTIKMLLLK